MALLCFPQCHRSGCLPTRKHLKSPFILLIGFSGKCISWSHEIGAAGSISSRVGCPCHVCHADELFGGRRGCFFLSGSFCCLLGCCAGTPGMYDHLCVLLLQASKAESAAAIHQLQDKEKMLAAVKEEAAVAKEQCKQLTQVNVKRFLRTEPRDRSRGLENEQQADAGLPSLNI